MEMTGNLAHGPFLVDSQPLDGFDLLGRQGHFPNSSSVENGSL
jgi:hypothetical protein